MRLTRYMASTPQAGLDTSMNTICITTSGQHSIEWIARPAMTWVGGVGVGVIESSPAHERGLCCECDERFTRELVTA